MTIHYFINYKSYYLTSKILQRLSKHYYMYLSNDDPPHLTNWPLYILTTQQPNITNQNHQTVQPKSPFSPTKIKSIILIPSMSTSLLSLIPFYLPYLLIRLIKIQTSDQHNKTLIPPRSPNSYFYLSNTLQSYNL